MTLYFRESSGMGNRPRAKESIDGAVVREKLRQSFAFTRSDLGGLLRNGFMAVSLLELSDKARQICLFRQTKQGPFLKYELQTETGKLTKSHPRLMPGEFRHADWMPLLDLVPDSVEVLNRLPVWVVKKLTVKEFDRIAYHDERVSPSTGNEYFNRAWIFESTETGRYAVVQRKVIISDDSRASEPKISFQKDSEALEKTIGGSVISQLDWVSVEQALSGIVE